MSSITYNGVTIQDVLTESIEQTAEFDASGADTIGMRCRVTVTGIIHTLGQYTLGVAGSIGSLASSVNEVVDKLLVPRRSFKMEIGGQTLFEVFPGAVPAGGGPTAKNLQSMDIANGPKTTVKVLKVLGTYSASVAFTVEFVRGTCSGSGNGILNLRFWIADRIDMKTWLTTRTYHGRLRLAHNHLNPHAFRNLVMPPVQPGFQPDDCDFVGSEDGLNLEFTIRHQEQWAMAPSPAVSWDGNHMVSSPVAGGALGESEVRVVLRGAKDTPKESLLALATQILRAKLHFDDMTSENSVFLLYAAYNDKFANNEIEATARVQHTGEASLLNIADKLLGKPLGLPGYNKEKAQPGSPTATTAGLFLCALQTACKPGMIGPYVDNEKWTEWTYHGHPSSITPDVAPLPSYDAKYSPDHKRYAYMEYKESNEYQEDTGLIALPFAIASNDQKNNKETCKFIRLYPPQVTRTVRINAERLNKWPDLPRPEPFKDSSGILHVPLKVGKSPHSPQLSGDGRKTLHTIDYDVTYRLDRAPTASESLRVGKIPLRIGASGEESISALPASVFVNPTSIV